MKTLKEGDPVETKRDGPGVVIKFDCDEGWWAGRYRRRDMVWVRLGAGQMRWLPIEQVWPR